MNGTAETLPTTEKKLVPDYGASSQERKTFKIQFKKIFCKFYHLFLSYKIQIQPHALHWDQSVMGCLCVPMDVMKFCAPTGRSGAVGLLAQLPASQGNPREAEIVSQKLVNQSRFYKSNLNANFCCSVCHLLFEISVPIHLQGSGASRPPLLSTLSS